MAGTQSMRRAWDRRAEEDALVAIEASRRDWTDDEFFADGRAMVEEAMAWIGEGVPRGGGERGRPESRAVMAKPQLATN